MLSLIVEYNQSSGQGGKVSDTIDEVVASENKAQYDKEVKELLGSKKILARILIKTVDEFKGMDIDDVIDCIDDDIHIDTVPTAPGMTNKEKGEQKEAGRRKKKKGDKLIGFNTESSVRNEGLARFDIIFYVRTKNGHSQVIINIEAQKSEPTEYWIVNRGIFYASRMISSQRDRDFVDMDYNDIKRVYSIWICCGVEDSCMSHIHLTEDVLLGKHKWKGDLDLFNIVLIGIADNLPEKTEEYEFHRLLGTLLSMNMSVDERVKLLAEEHNIKRDEYIERRLARMCNLSQGVQEYGMKLGKAEGRVEGRTEGRVMDIRNLMSSLEWSAVQAMDALKIPQEDRETYLSELRKS